MSDFNLDLRRDRASDVDYLIEQLRNLQKENEVIIQSWAMNQDIQPTWEFGSAGPLRYSNRSATELQISCVFYPKSDSKRTDDICNRIAEQLQEAVQKCST